MTTHRPDACPLCTGTETAAFHRDRRRDYLRCPACGLVFVPRNQHLSTEAEKAQYDLHRNDPADTRYRAFLGRLFAPLAARLQPGATGLDFGSGPGPTLSLMFEEAGYTVRLFDPFYAPEPSAFEQRYDFITASEVVEHLRDPAAELERLWDCLVPDGWLGIMTKRVRDRDAFARWHYKDDPTHIVFFAEETFEWLARTWKAELAVAGDDVVLLRKRRG